MKGSIRFPCMHIPSLLSPRPASASACSAEFPPVAAVLLDQLIVQLSNTSVKLTVHLLYQYKDSVSLQYLSGSEYTYVTNVCGISMGIKACITGVEVTHRHGLIGTTRLHLVVGALSLLAPSALERVRLGLGLSNSLGLEQVFARNLFV